MPPLPDGWRSPAASGTVVAMHRIRLAVAAGLALIGMVWIGQGFDLISGSAMTGDRRWALAGTVLLVVAVIVALAARRRPDR